MPESDSLRTMQKKLARFWADNRFAVLGLLIALAVLEIFVAYTIGRDIETNLRNEAASRLTTSGFDRVEPKASGRDITLEGQAFMRHE